MLARKRVDLYRGLFWFPTPQWLSDQGHLRGSFQFSLRRWVECRDAELDCKAEHWLIGISTSSSLIRSSAIPNPLLNSTARWNPLLCPILGWCRTIGTFANERLLSNQDLSFTIRDKKRMVGSCPRSASRGWSQQHYNSRCLLSQPQNIEDPADLKKIFSTYL